MPPLLIPKDQMPGAILAYEHTCARLIEALQKAGLSDDDIKAIGYEILQSYKNTASEGIALDAESQAVTTGLSVIERVLDKKRGD